MCTGIVFCESITTPVEIKDSFYEFAPVYQKISNFALDDVSSPVMRRYAEKHGVNPPKEFLTTVYNGTNLILPTEVVVRFFIFKNRTYVW